jgi:asparagine synthase (glutamine-hydrolysing)
MSGIAGILRYGKLVNQEDLLCMCDGMQQHGPAGHGLYIENPVSLAHTDFNGTGRDKRAGQPMSNEDGTLWITCDGEIYNHIELRKELEKEGHIFRSEIDTEMVIHAYEQWGSGCLEKFNGMFAFAIWSKPRQELFLARDRVGQKPLYYHAGAGEFRFASELQTLMKPGGIPRCLNLQALELYFTFLYIPAPFTIYQDVWKLPPATWMLVRPDSLISRHYWQAGMGEAGPPRNNWLETLHSLLDQAVRRQLLADVPLGIFLSGGLDSSTVLAFASRYEQPLDTFTVGLGRSRDELSPAREVAAAFQTRHHEVTVAPPSPELLRELVRLYGEPFADSSAIPVYELARQAKPLISVALGGDGGDELFGGYRWYRRIAMDTGKTIEEKFLSGCQMNEQEKDCLFSFPCDHGLVLELFHQHISPGRKDDLDNIIQFDFKVRLPGLFLTKTGIAGTACGVEMRSPLLDRDLVDYVLALPLEIRLGTGENFELKKSLRKVLRNYALLPTAVIEQGKQGFGAPLHDWLRNGLKAFSESLLCDRKSMCWQFLNRGYVEERLHRFYAGTDDQAYFFWKVIIFELWLKEFMA